jgi:hypothetical protein
LTDAGGDDVGLDELHGVVDRETRGDGAARRVDVELNVALRIFCLEKEHLGGGQIGDVIVNGCADENDVLFEEAGIDVVSAFATAGLLHDHGYERRPAIFWFVESFHLSKVCVTLVFLGVPNRFISIPSRRRCEFGNSARANREFCHSAASLSSYRACLALSNERESLLRIRHCEWPRVQARD